MSFTNAVLRRLAEGIGPLLDSLPDTSPAEAGLKHSYPDWIAETWWRDLGPAGALDLMRSLNEPGHAVVRLVRGEVEGTPDRDVAGAWRVDRIDAAALADGRIWPQSSASQLVGPRGRRTARRADARPLRGARRQGDDARGRGHCRRDQRRACSRAGGERAPSRRVARSGRGSRRPRAAGRAHRLRPRARGCALLRPRCPEPPPGPALARRATAGAPARAPSCRSRASPHGRHDRLLGLHGQRRRVRRRRRCFRPRGGSGVSPTSGPDSGTRAGPSSCRRFHTFTTPPASSSRGCGAKSRGEDPARCLDTPCRPARIRVPRPGNRVRDTPPAGSLAVEAELAECIEPAPH